MAKSLTSAVSLVSSSVQRFHPDPLRRAAGCLFVRGPRQSQQQDQQLRLLHQHGGLPRPSLAALPQRGHQPRRHSSTRERRKEAVTSILEKNQLLEGERVAGAVHSYDQNFHNANDPIEDSHAQAVLPHREDCMIFAVVDGHAGKECGQIVSKRLFTYVSAGLLSKSQLKQHYEARRDGNVESEFYEIVHKSNELELDLPEEVQKVYEDNYLRYLKDLLRSQKDKSDVEENEKSTQEIHDHLERAFVALDDDISQESCMRLDGDGDKFLRRVGLSGCVAALALVDRGDLHVAGTGDCSVVLGTLSENDTWVATKLSDDHAPHNSSEWNRILEEHPGERGDAVFANGRLCGVLMPTRAFGDFKLKWPVDRIRRFFGAKHVLKNYKTPPYLTARPETTHHVLTPRDKFLIIASDGLWDQMSPMQVIRLLGEHLHGKVVLTPLPIRYREEVKMRDIISRLRDRQEAMKLKPDDVIGATHLLRYALGSASMGIDYGRLVQVLGLPAGAGRRGVHDDITVTAVYFDFDYIRKMKGARGVDLYPGRSLEEDDLSEDEGEKSYPREEKMQRDDEEE